MAVTNIIIKQNLVVTISTLFCISKGLEHEHAYIATQGKMKFN